MQRKCKEKCWTKKYRLALMILLLAILVISGWYYISSSQNGKKPESGTLVKQNERKYGIRNERQA